MTTLENLYYGNINPSEYKQSKDTKKKLSEITALLDELESLLTTKQQKEKLEQIDCCQLSLIALSEHDTYLEGFKLGVKMATEIYADTQQRLDWKSFAAVYCKTHIGTPFLLPKRLKFTI